nr:ABC transporter substrate-binding protein [Rhodococcus sp. HNM0569]
MSLTAVTVVGCSSSEGAGATRGTETRAVETPGGVVDVPVDPQRIVTTHNIGTQPLLDLGIVPVGAASVPPSIVVPEYMRQIADVPVVTDGESVDVEEIAALEPDLIFSHSGTDPAVLAQLRALAPVVLVPIEGELRSDWQRRIDVVADAVGRTDRKADLDADLERHARDVATRHADVLARETVSFLDSYDAQEFWAYGPESMVGEILTSAGARFAPSTRDMTPTRGPGERQMSREDLGDYVDGSLVLYSSTMSDPVQPFGQVGSLVASPLLTGSPAGQAGRVHPGGYALVSNYGQAGYLLDRFDDALAAAS